MNESAEKYMGEALLLAQAALELGEVPVGAVIVFEGSIVGRGYNRREIDKNPLAHAELMAILEASQSLERWRLSGCTLYVTLEPCPMCAGALVNSRIDKVVFGATDKKAGAVSSLMELCSDSRLNHRLEVQGGVLAEESADLLRSFFRKLRK